MTPHEIAYSKPPVLISTENEPCLLTHKQIAAKLRISLGKLHDWKRRKVIPYLVIGGIVRFEMPRVLAALRAYETPVSPELVKPEKLGINRTGLTSRDARGRLAARKAATS